MVSANSYLLMALLSAAPGVEVWEFTAPWCHSCRGMEPVVTQLVNEGIPVRQIPFDDYRELAAQSKVQSLPTFLVVSNGRILNRATGSQTAGQIREMLRRSIEPVGSQISNHSRNSHPDCPDRSTPVIRGQQATPPGPLGRINNAMSSFTDRLSNRGATANSAPLTAPNPFRVEAAGPRSNPRLALPNLAPAVNAAPIGTAGTAPPNALASYQAPPKPFALAPASVGNRANANESPTASVDPIRFATNATVLIRVHDATGISLGTGTIVDSHGDEALVLTCGHIFRDSKGKGRITCSMQTPGGPQKLPAAIVGYDLQRDVGLISFRPGVPFAPVKVAGGGYLPKDRQPVFAIGCGRGEPASVIRNRIIAVNRYQGPSNLVVGGRPIDGRSGGGLFDESGMLIGVCNAADPEADEGLYAALGPIHATLDNAKLGFVYQQQRANAAAAVAPVGPSAGVNEPNALGSQFASTNNTPQAAAGVPAPMSVTNTPMAGSEVICIVRPKNGDGSAGKAYVIDKPSPRLLGTLSEELGKRSDHSFTNQYRANPEATAAR